MAFAYAGEIGDEPIVWKTEGLPDAISLRSLGVKDGITTNACGAGEKPVDWYCQKFAGKEVFIVHDCDLAGQFGSIGKGGKGGWARAIAKYAKVVRNVILPYPIQKSKGPDLGDWIDEQREAGKDNETIYRELLEIARRSEIITGEGAVIVSEERGKPPGEPPSAVGSGEDEFDDDEDDPDEPSSGDTPNDDGPGDQQPGKKVPRESIDDPDRLARINLEIYREETGGTLRFWQGQWFKYKRGVYRELSRSDLAARMRANIREDFVSNWEAELEEYEEWLVSDSYDPKKDKGEPNVRKVSRAILFDSIAALESMCLMASSTKLPSWLKGDLGSDDGSKRNYLSMENGLLDLDAITRSDVESIEDVLRPHSERWFSLVQLKYPFDVNADCPRWLEFIESAMEGDIERMSVLQEWCGYLLMPGNPHQKFFAMEGNGGNGKTVFTAGLTAMIGEDNVSNVQLEKFGGQFDLYQTLGKLANICGDVGEIDKAAEAEIKQFCGGDSMSFDRKRRDPVKATPTAKLVVSWNLRPHFRDRSMGIWRRMILVPFLYKPTEEEKQIGMDVPEFWLKRGEASGILNWAIVGLQRLIEQGQFTRSDVIEREISKYRIESNPAIEFLSEHVEVSKDSRIPTAQLYDFYRHFCEKAGVRHVLRRNMFGVEVNRHFGEDVSNGRSLISAGGSRERVYCGIRFKEDVVDGKSVDDGNAFF